MTTPTSPHTTTDDGRSACQPSAGRRVSGVAGRVADTVLYGGVAGMGLWWLLIHMAAVRPGAALLLAALTSLAVAARVWRSGPPAWWLRLTTLDNIRIHLFRGQR